MASETRLKAWLGLGPQIIVIVEGDELPGDLALGYDDGEWRLFVAHDATTRRPARDVAHDAAHMLLGARRCCSGCEELTGAIEGWLLTVLALADLA